MADMSEADVRKIVTSAVHDTLQLLGVDTTDPLAMQRDFQHLREWRETVNSVKAKGVMTILTILVTGGIGALWVGIQHAIGK